LSQGTIGGTGTNGIWQHGIVANRGRGLYFGWNAAQNACPEGWRIPTPQEFGRNSNEGLWQTLNAMPNNNNADNPRRFWQSAPYALAGYRQTNGSWLYWGAWGGWWSSASGQHFHLFSTGIPNFGPPTNVGFGLSLRCILNE